MTSPKGPPVPAPAAPPGREPAPADLSATLREATSMLPREMGERLGAAFRAEEERLRATFLRSIAGQRESYERTRPLCSGHMDKMEGACLGCRLDRAESHVASLRERLARAERPKSPPHIECCKAMDYGHESDCDCGRRLDPIVIAANEREARALARAEAAEARASRAEGALERVWVLIGQWETYESPSPDSKVEKTLQVCAEKLRAALASPLGRPGEGGDK